MERIRTFFNSFNREQKFILAFCLIIIICSMCRDCFLCHYVPKLDGFQLRRVEGFQDSVNIREFQGDKPNLVYYSQDWCHFCQEFNKDWDKLTTKLTEANPIKIIGGDKGAMDKIMETEKIQGYPTIILYKKKGSDVVKIPFQGQSSVENLIQFVKENK